MRRSVDSLDSLAVDKRFGGFMSASHDPRREVEKLRAHLAGHDKPIGFLIGAGGSSAVRDTSGGVLIPAVVALTVLCRDAVHALGDSYPELYSALEGEFGPKSQPNVEEVLSSVRRKISAMSSTDKLAGADRAALEKVEETLRRTIAAVARPTEARIPDQLPHHSLGRWIGRIPRAFPVEIFTTNYDTLLERGLEDQRVPVFDGFVGSRRPFFVAGSLVRDDAAPGRSWARLWKIHGSINWSRQTLRDGSTRVVRGDESDTGELILPSFHKYDESRKQPYVAMLDRLGRFLTAREDTVLFTLGYSFGDQHINEVLFEALDLQPRVHVVALQFADVAFDSELLRRARQHQNLVVFGPSQAVVGGVVGDWQLLEPVDDATARLMDVPFDTDGIPDPNTASLTGRFRLGDFNYFAAFLDEIAGPDR
jgi:hypothetical protein